MQSWAQIKINFLIFEKVDKLQQITMYVYEAIAGDKAR